MSLHMPGQEDTTTLGEGTVSASKESLSAQAINLEGHY